MKKPSVFNVKDFWEHFCQNSLDECWEYPLHRTVAGYGRHWVYPKYVLAHRLAWELTYGEIPEGMCVCHKCDNPPCCNPNHLFLGTHRDNMRDCKEKGRNSHGPILYGEKHPTSKLTEEDVREIRRVYVPTPRQKSEFNCAGLAEKYGVARSLIHRIVKRESWPHVE